MADTRKKGKFWTIFTNTDGTTPNEHVQFALLMDIRDELQTMNGTLGRIENLARCVNVARGFIAMNKIRLHLEKHGARPKLAPKKRAKR